MKGSVGLIVTGYLEKLLFGCTGMATQEELPTIAHFHVGHALTGWKGFSLGWHAALFPTGYSGLQKIHVGKYRGSEEMQIVSGPIGREIIHYVAPPQNVLKSEMSQLIKWVNTNDEHSAMLKAGITHLWFIMIHPFDDGNGRVGRAVTDYIMTENYPALMNIVSFSKHISKDRHEMIHPASPVGISKTVKK